MDKQIDRFFDAVMNKPQYISSVIESDKFCDLIKKNKIVFKRKIAAGSFGEVSMILNAGMGEIEIPVVVKTMFLDKICDKKPIIKCPELLNEVLIGIIVSKFFDSIQEPFAIRYYSFFKCEEQKQQDAYLLMQKVDFTVDKFLLDWDERYMSPTDVDVEYIMFQITYALYELQKNFEFTHYDLHLGNVMIYVIRDDDPLVPEKYKNKIIEYEVEGVKYYLPNLGYVIKITDFGFARLKYQGKLINGVNRRYYLGKYSSFYDLCCLSGLLSIHKMLPNMGVKALKHMCKLLQNICIGNCRPNVWRPYYNYSQMGGNGASFMFNQGVFELFEDRSRAVKIKNNIDSFAKDGPNGENFKKNLRESFLYYERSVLASPEELGSYTGIIKRLERQGDKQIALEQSPDDLEQSGVIRRLKTESGYYD